MFQPRISSRGRSIIVTAPSSRQLKSQCCNTNATRSLSVPPPTPPPTEREHLCPPPPCRSAHHPCSSRICASHTLVRCPALHLRRHSVVFPDHAQQNDVQFWVSSLLFQGSFPVRPVTFYVFVPASSPHVSLLLYYGSFVSGLCPHVKLFFPSHRFLCLHRTASLVSNNACLTSRRVVFIKYH